MLFLMIMGAVLACALGNFDGYGDSVKEKTEVLGLTEVETN